MFIVIIVLFHYFLADTFPNRFNFALNESESEQEGREKKKKYKINDNTKWKEDNIYVHTHFIDDGNGYCVEIELNCGL